MHEETERTRIQLGSLMAVRWAILRLKIETPDRQHCLRNRLEALYNREHGNLGPYANDIAREVQKVLSYQSESPYSATTQETRPRKRRRSKLAAEAVNYEEATEKDLPGGGVDSNAGEIAEEGWDETFAEEWEDGAVDEVLHESAHGASVGEVRPQEGREVVHDWLLSLDNGSGSLLQYLDALADEFNADLVQIAAARNDTALASSGPLASIEPLFWEAVGVTKLGHQLLLAKGIVALSASLAKNK